MNSFVIEKLTEFTFKKVKYYSIRYVEKNSDEDIENDVNEFFDFLNRMEDIPEIENDLKYLLIWIEDIIGDTFGAQPKYFRNEAIISDTSALPPPRGQMKFNKIVVEDLRLYCFVANENVVFLFNGSIKSKNVIKAQDCPNVAPYIKKANTLTKVINSLFQSGEIKWNSNQTDILFDNTQEFNL